VKELTGLTAKFGEAVGEEMELSHEERIVKNVGKMDAKRHLGAGVEKLMTSNITQVLGTMLDTTVF
jgi:26S proteasome regulatory subunit N11